MDGYKTVEIVPAPLSFNALLVRALVIVPGGI